jgi:hypothetical protein
MVTFDTTSIEGYSGRAARQVSRAASKASSSGTTSCMPAQSIASGARRSATRHPASGGQRTVSGSPGSAGVGTHSSE